jgi:hypothetical protein
LITALKIYTADNWDIWWFRNEEEKKQYQDRGSFINSNLGVFTEEEKKKLIEYAEDITNEFGKLVSTWKCDFLWMMFKSYQLVTIVN